MEFIESEDSPIVGFMKHKDSVVQILSFDRLLQNTKNKTEVIVSFLAMLELMRQREIILKQEKIFGKILIRKTKIEL